jgi:hypothetical protein
MAMEASIHSGNEEQQQQQQQQQQEKKASQLFAQRALQERRLKPPDQVVPCPRCQSLNTKFCYYNNYSLTQPRHFCKNCRRYWTAGGTLRNVPVGGGCRKNKRAKHQQQQQQHRGNAVDHASVLQLQPSLISGISTVTDSFSAQQQQHSAQLQGSSSSASFFNGEPGGAMHFLTSSQQQQQQQQPTWSSQQSDVQANVEAAGALAFTTHSGQGGPAGQNLSHHSQAFANSGIMSLGLFNSVSSKSDAGAAAGGGGGPGLSTHTSQQVHAGGRGGDLTAFFENPAAAYSTRVGNLGALSEAGHHGSSYNHNTVSSDDIAAQEASSYARGGGGGGGGDIWRNLQQQQQLKQEVLWGQPESERSASVLDLNSRQQASKSSAKFSSPGSTLSPAAAGAGHGLLDHAESKLAVRPAAVGWQQQQQQQQQSASHHHHQAGGMPNYETVTPPDTHFWSNPGWPPLDLHTLHGSGGTQLL